MLAGRDRALAWFLAVQLVIAGIFGGVLVHVLRHPSTQQVLSSGTTGGDSAVVPGATAGPSAVAGKPGSTSKTVGGTQGQAGTQGTSGQGGGGATSSVPKGPTVAAGAALSFGSIVTQNFSISFKDSKDGTSAFLSQLNAKGGANGHKINMMYLDDQGSSTTGYSDAQSLVNQGVLALAAFNAPLTEGYSSFKTLIDKTGIPLIGSYGESLEYKDQYTFAFSSNYVHFGYEDGMFLVKHGAKVPGFIYVDNSPDTAANDEIVRGFRAGIKAAGGDPDKAQAVKVSTTELNYDQTVSTLQQAGVDGFASIIDNTGYVRLLQSQARANYYPTHVADPLFDLDSVKSKASTDKHPVYVATDLDFLETGGPQVQAYVSAVKAMNKVPSYLGEQGWLDASYLAQAVGKLKTSFTRSDLLAAVNSLSSFDNGFTNALTIAPGNHDMNRCIKFGQITNAVLTQVQGWTCDTQQP